MTTTHIPCFDHDTVVVFNGIASGHEKAVQEVLLPVVKVEKEKVEKLEKVEKAGEGMANFPDGHLRSPHIWVAKTLLRRKTCRFHSMTMSWPQLAVVKFAACLKIRNKDVQHLV